MNVHLRGDRSRRNPNVSAPLHLNQIWNLACRFVPLAAADRRLHDSGSNSWWPAHEIGHFLVATRAECHEPKFGIDTCAEQGTSMYRYVIAKEIAAIAISQRLLRRSGHSELADDEIQYTDENTIECSFERWCKRSVHALLRKNHVIRLPSTATGIERLLARKARQVGTTPQ